MRTKIYLGLCAMLMTMVLVPKASAGVHLEPFLSYGFGKWGTSASEEDFKGVLYGGRLGYSIPMFSIGAEYQGGSLKDESKPAYTLKPTDLGVYVSVEFPIMLRAYATYYFNSKVNVSGGNLSTDLDYQGKGYKLGIGFTALPLVSINLEYIAHEYDEVELGGTSIKLTDKVKADGIAIGVSVPFNF